jgi:hypothetical protein
MSFRDAPSVILVVIGVVLLTVLWTYCTPMRSCERNVLFILKGSVDDCEVRGPKPEPNPAVDKALVNR